MVRMKLEFIKKSIIRDTIKIMSLGLGLKIKRRGCGGMVRWLRAGGSVSVVVKVRFRSSSSSIARAMITVKVRSSPSSIARAMITVRVRSLTS
jgi:hypothetical protein